MKKFLALIIGVLLMLLNCLTVAAQTPIAISSESDLAALKNAKKSYYLENDIVLSNDFTPIEGFGGNFDGRNKRIINLKIQIDAKPTDGTVYAGLFKKIDGANIQNLTLQNVKINVTGASTAYVGGVVGKIVSGTVSNCRVSGEIGASGSNSVVFAGGIAGTNNAEVKLCENNAKITVNSRRATVGGIVGEHPRVDYALKECVNNGEISAIATAAENYVGGIAGKANYTIKNCASFGQITLNALGEAFAGGITSIISTGKIETCYSGGVISCFGKTDSYADPMAARHTNSFSNNYYLDTVISGLNTAEIKTASALENKSVSNAANFRGFDFDSVWQITANGPGLKGITTAKIQDSENDDETSSSSSSTSSSSSPANPNSSSPVNSSGSSSADSDDISSEAPDSDFSSTMSDSTSHDTSSSSSTQSRPFDDTFSEDDSVPKKNALPMWLFVIIVIIVAFGTGVAIFVIYNKKYIFK